MTTLCCNLCFNRFSTLKIKLTCVRQPTLGTFQFALTDQQLKIKGDIGEDLKIND